MPLDNIVRLKVTPVVDDIMTQMKQLPHMKVDETTVIVLKNKDHPAWSYKGYMWVYNNTEGCVYKYASSIKYESRS